MWWLLGWMAVAAEPDCEWQSPAEAFGIRHIYVGEALTVLTPREGQVDVVRARSRLANSPKPELHTTFTSDQVVVRAVLRLDEAHPMSLVGRTLQYGEFGTLPPGSAVHITEADGQSVTVVPSSVRVEEVEFEGAERVLPCEGIAPRRSSYSLEAPSTPERPADDEVLFDMGRPFRLSTDATGGDSVLFRPMQGKMRLEAVEQGERRTRFVYRDRYGATWRGWSTAAELAAPNRGPFFGGGGGYAAIGIPSILPQYRCPVQVPLYTRRGVEIGHVRAGAIVGVRATDELAFVEVAWLKYRLVLRDIKACTLMPGE